VTDASTPTPPARRSFLPGHFELKILAALFAVALLSLLGAAALLKTTLGSVNELTSQHQHQVRRSLDDAVEAYRTFFAAAKEGFREHAQRLGARRVEHAAELADEPDLVRVDVLDGTRVRDTWEASPARRHELQEAPSLVVDNPASGPARRLELTFGIRREIYANFLSLRGAMDQELELDRVFPLVMPRLYRGLALALGVVLVVATVLGLVLAAVLFDYVAKRFSARTASLFRSGLYVPQVLPVAVSGIVWGWLLLPDGAVNALAKDVGLGGLARDWLGNPDSALPSVLGIMVWMQIGYPVVMFMAGLQRVNPELYEAAEMDGAGWWVRFRRITVPQVRPELYVVLATTTIAALKTFAQVFVLTRGGPGNATLVPSYFAYRSFFEDADVGYGSAISSIMVLLILVVGAVFVRLQTRADQGGGR